MDKKNFLFQSLFVAVLFAVFVRPIEASLPCALREEKYGYVCVCNATYCDYLEEPVLEHDEQFVIISSSKEGLRFDQTIGKFNLFNKVLVLDRNYRSGAQPDSEPHISSETTRSTRYVALTIDRDVQYQKIVGFGGSFTGAVSYLLEHLSQELQDNIYEAFYSAERGLGFNLMRIPIGGSDFDLEAWAYNEEPEDDLELTNFTKLDARDEQKVTQIKRLLAVSKISNLKIKGAAWSAPRWMKSNNKWTGFSHLKKQYYQTWADYHLKWLELMDESGLPVWAISTGNEPMNGVFFMMFVKFVSLGWTPKNQAVWLADHLGPTIRNSTYKDVLILGNDDQRYTMPYWFHKMNSTREDSLDYIDGLAVHWYWNEIFEPFFMDKIIEEMPGRIFLTTESCIGDKPWQKAAPLLGSWERGEKYARSYMQDLQHGSNGWIDWNLILDEQGGPNYVNNTVDAAIIVDMANTKEVLKQPFFYSIGHFSKFIPEGSVRIDAVKSNVNVDSVAFLRPDGQIAVIFYNTANAYVEVTVIDSIKSAIVVVIPPRSIHTLIYK